MEAGDVSPVPTEKIMNKQKLLLYINDSNDVQAPTYLLRQMINAEDEASGEFGLSSDGAESCASS